MARYFIARPIFAWVIALVLMLAGIGSFNLLPIAQYPDVSPPTVGINATYPGASAQVLQDSVTQVIEQQLSGLDGLLYFQSTSSDAGSVTISVTFANGTNPDIAQVQVQNKVQQALPRLPTQVQQQGLTVTKRSPDFLMIVAVYDATDRSTSSDVSDFNGSTLQDPLSRLPGVGEITAFGSQYAMRIWLDPYKLAANQLMPSDVQTAVQAQNVQVSAGQIGGLPLAPGAALNATVTAQSRLTKPQEFRDIILKTQPNGAVVRIGDVARVELGDQDYSSFVRYNRHPGSGLAISLAPGADALETAETVKAKVESMRSTFPPGFQVAYVRDSTAFIELSIHEVEKTLFEAILLVVLIMFLFLQDWRATLVPAIAIPVVLLGTFAVLAATGFSINTLTLFGMVLAIGLLVDDAIVVVENVERVMEEKHLSALDATVESMDEISGALIGIAMVLAAVFLPMAFFGGSIGTIYRQFSVTIVSSMALSVAVALILTPALCAKLLKPKWELREAREAHPGSAPTRALRRFFAGFDRRFDAMTERYVSGVEKGLAHGRWMLAGFVLIVALLALFFVRLPTGFLPTEDIGQAIVQYQLPPGTTRDRTEAAAAAVEKYFLGSEHNVDGMFANSGRNFNGTGQNVGQAFLMLKPWDDRPGRENSSTAVVARAQVALKGMRDAQIITVLPPPISGFGQTNGFTLELMNQGGLSPEAFTAAKDRLLAAANADPLLTAVRLGSLEDTPHLQVTVDNSKVGALGLTQANVNSTLSAAWGGTYINDFVDRGRVKRVYMQGDAPFRDTPESLNAWHVRADDGSMAPFSAIASTSFTRAPSTLQRFNGISSFEIQGQAAGNRSSGDAMKRILELVQKTVPGASTSWSGLSYQENISTGQAPLLYGVSILVIFLCLAALYESWSIPFSVLMVIPLGVIGAVLAVMLRSLDNNVYFQVGLLTTIGLAAKNAILIVEFALVAETQHGKSAHEAAVEAARLRLRPILMTSLAFIAGTLPLALSSGAGAQSRIALGTAVVGGMITATVLAIFFVPFFYVGIRSLSDRFSRKGRAA
ncbi:efflux RND transporter permease subunit [Sphingomonas morindae]|uniref:Efflux pump membrane transporter n=1 Tax=Sphingomonas morindae TaxID=1541170 RepID=A0ABY4XC89_9SPHN|nr:efflux RND transporter permease subunit [Sphingomonas morindae]